MILKSSFLLNIAHCTAPNGLNKNTIATTGIIWATNGLWKNHPTKGAAARETKYRMTARPQIDQNAVLWYSWSISSFWMSAAWKPHSLNGLMNSVNTMTIAKMPKSAGFNSLAKMIMMTNLMTCCDPWLKMFHPIPNAVFFTRFSVIFLGTFLIRDTWNFRPRRRASAPLR